MIRKEEDVACFPRQSNWAK